MGCARLTTPSGCAHTEDMTTARITHLIAGAPWEGTADRTSDVYNPATGEVSGTLDLASADLVDDETGSAHGKRVQALGGAKNHMLVLPDADLDLAADAAINAGFGSAGERCMAISALVAVDSIADDLVARIRDRMGKLRTGDGTRGSDMGPLVTAQHREKVASYIDAGVDAGAELVVDGRNAEFDADGDGFFLAPTLFDQVSTEMSIYTDEIFGPVLSVVRVASYDEGLELINRNPYGNGTAIFTNDGGAARRFQNEVEVGMVGRERADPGAGVLLLVRRLEEQPVRGHPRTRDRGRALLHPRQGGHLPLARPEPRRRQPRVPAERLIGASRQPGQSAGRPRARESASSTSIRHARTRSTSTEPRVHEPPSRAEEPIANRRTPARTSHGTSVRRQATPGCRQLRHPRVALRPHDQVVGAVRQTTGRAGGDHRLQAGQADHVAPGVLHVERGVEPVEEPRDAAQLGAHLRTCPPVDLQVAVEEAVGDAAGAELDEGRSQRRQTRTVV